MGSGRLQPIFLAEVDRIESIDDVREALRNLIADLNDRFDQLSSDAVGISASISQTALTYTSGILANTPALGNSVLFQFSATQASIIPGFSGGYGGRLVVIQNTSSYAYTIAHESSSALAAHRITTRTKADLSVTSGAGIVLLYDQATQRWLPVCTQL